MIRTDKMPDKGQFVAVWEFNGLPWSRTLRARNAELHYYDPRMDVWYRYGRREEWPLNPGEYFLVNE